MKIVIALLTVALLLAAFFMVLFQKPTLFFPNAHKIGQIEYFSETDYPILNDSIFEVTNSRIMARVKKSELFDSVNFTAKVYLSNPRWLHKAHSFFMSEADAFCLWAVNGSIYLYEPYFFITNTSMFNLEEQLSHELTHKIILDRFGKEKYRKIPKWLNEGYCEFIARDYINATNLKSDRYQQILGRSDIYNYDNYLLAVTYLMIYKRRSFESLVHNPPDFEQVLKEMEHWQYTPKNCLKIPEKHIV